jgi:hypothetical protein
MHRHWDNKVYILSVTPRFLQLARGENRIPLAGSEQESQPMVGRVTLLHGGEDVAL